MDQFWVEIVKQAPGIAAVILVVVMFLRFTDKILQDAKITFKEIRDSCHVFHNEVIKDSNGAINNCTLALSENTRMLGRMDKYVANGDK